MGEPPSPFVIFMLPPEGGGGPVYEGPFPRRRLNVDDSARFNVSVQTLIYRKDGSLFADLGTMRWQGVNQQIVEWFTASCKTTAFWLLEIPEATGDDSYTLKYRTVVSMGGHLVSDTTLLEFENLTYFDTVRFERWALRELDELLQLFERQHVFGPEPTKRRSKVKAALSIAWQVIRNKFRKGNG